MIDNSKVSFSKHPLHKGKKSVSLHLPTCMSNDWTILTIRTIYEFSGSDLKALCSEAVLKALRRVYPQVYESEHALVIDTKNVSIHLF